MQQLKTSTSVDKGALTERSVTIFFEPCFTTLTGRWYWDLSSDSVFCSNVMLSFPHIFEGTKGIIHPDDVDQLKEKLQADKIRRVEFRIITTYGEVKTIVGESVTVYARTDEAEARLQQVAQAAVEKKEFEQLLLFKEMYEKVNRLTHTGVWWYNDTTKETWYSAEVFRIYGLAPFSLNPHLNTFLCFIHAEEREVVEEFLNRSYREKIPLHIEYRIQTSIGEKYVQHVSQWSHSINGQCILSGMLKDVTEEKKKEKETGESQQKINFFKQQLLFDEQNNHLGHWYVNLVTRKFVFSDNYYRLFGIKRKTLTETPAFHDYIHSEDREAYRLAIKKMLHQHAVPEIDFRIYRSDGKLRYLSQKAKLLADGNELIMMGTIEDITVEVLLKKKIKELTDAEAVRSFAQKHSEEMAAMAGWIWNTSDNSIKWSENFYSLLALKPSSKEITHKLFFSFVYPDDQKMFRDNMNLLMQQKQENKFSFRLLLWGKTRYMKASFRMMKHQEDEMFIAIFRDVTKEHLLEEELKQRIQLAEALSETILDRIIITDVHHTIRLWNKACDETYGMSADEVTGKNFFDVFPNKKTEEEIALFNRVLKGERIFLKANRSTTIPRYYDLHLLPLWDGEHNEVNGIVHILHDVTHEMELQQSLNERFSFIESLVEFSPDYIIALDRNMNYLIWNKKCEDYYGLKKEQIIGKNVLEVFPTAHNTPAYEHFRKVLKGETVHLIATDEDNKHEVYLLPVKNEKQHINAILWIEHDLSKEMESAKQLKEQARLLETIFNAALEGIIVLKALRNNEGAMVDYEVVVDNAVTQKWNGQSIVGKKCVEDFPSFKKSGLFEAYNKVIETNEPLDTELFYESERFNNWFRIKAVKLSGDELVVTAEDITERKKAEEEIKKNLTILQNTEQLAQIGSWEYEIASGQFNWSEGMYRMFGLPQQMRVRPEVYLNHAAEHDRSIAKRIINNIQKQHQPFEEIMMIKREGENRLLKIKGSVVVDEKGKLQKVVGVDLDITDIKKAEEKLKESQHWLEQTAKASPDSISIYDLQKKQPIYLNDCLSKWMGVSNDDLLQMGIEKRLKLVHPDDRLNLLHHNEKTAAANNGDTITLEYRIQTNEGKTIWLRNRSKPFLRDASGKVTHILSILQNVTDEVNLREELKRRTQYAEAIIDASIDRIAVYDKERRIIAWNRRSEEITGKKKQNVLGQKLFDVFPEIAQDEELLKAHLDALEGSYVSVPARKRIYTNIYYEHFLVPLKDERNGVYAIVSIMHDVSVLVQRNNELSELNQSLEQKNAELEQKNEEITNFAFVASHDMKEPLRKIHTFSDWLMEQERAALSSKGKNLIEKMNAAVHRMEILIEDILALTKIHSDTHKEDNVNLNEILKQVFNDMFEQIVQTQTGVHAGELPVIKGNANQIFYLFKNLISNAIKFQKPGNVPLIKITAELISGGELNFLHPEEKYAKISFIDNGFGFDQRYAKKIFQVFQRLHGRHEFEGTGIGLAICKKIMENHKGMITVESEPGKGSVFNCYFPLH